MLKHEIALNYQRANLNCDIFLLLLGSDMNVSDKRFENCPKCAKMAYECL